MSKTKTKTKSSKKHSLKKNSTKKQTELSIKSLIDNDSSRLVHITYNKKPYGYFLLGSDMFQYYGQRKIKFNIDNTTNIDYEKLEDKSCINIYFHKDKYKPNNYEYAYLADFFYSRKNELCLTKKNIKPVDMFPLFDIFIQEFKLHKLNLYDASTLHLKYCNYSLKLLGLIEKNYTYYNKFGFIPILPKNKKTTTETTTVLPTTTTSATTTKKTQSTKKITKEDFNKPLKLTPITKTTKKMLKAVKDLQNIKINEMLNILKHYHIDLSDGFIKTKDILFDNISEQLKYRIKNFIHIYNKENLKNTYKYSYNQILKLTLKEFISEFILFFCNYKKDNIKYVEEVNYIPIVVNYFIETFKRKPINKVNTYSKLYYYGKNGINTMTGFDIETKKFIIKQCPKYEISINKNIKTNIVEIIINDI